MIRRILVIFLVIFFLSPAEAAHLKGGYIEYDYLGPTPGNPGRTRFRIRVFQYLDCASAGGQIDSEIYLGFFNLDDNSLFSTDIIPLNYTNIVTRKEFKCIDFPPNICYRIDSYETTVDLINNQKGYQLSVQRCCRIASINNISNSVNSGITYSVKLLTNGVTPTFINNSSPVFAREDTALVCANNGFKLPFNATDPDGDSLVFSFTSGLSTPTREAKPLPPIAPPYPDLIYAGVYSPFQPLGNKVGIDRKTGLISGIAPETSGDYVVAVLVEEYRNGVKIGETRKEIHVTVASCTSPQALLPPSIINCNNFDVTFTNLSNSPGILSYYWDFGVAGVKGDTSIGAAPNFTYPDTGVYIATLVINRQALCNDSTSTEVRIFPGFTPDFSFKGVCNLLPYNFIDQSKTSYGSISSWHWDFGVTSTSADTSAIKNPGYLYSDIGTYNASLKVTSSKGCEGIVVKPVLVSDKPEVELAFKDTLICSKDTLQLMALVPGNYNWTPNYNIINANSISPLVYPKKTTTYTVTLDDSGCKAVDTVRVNVVDFVTLFAGNDTTICLTDGIRLQPFSNGNEFVWNPASTLDDPTIKNPVATPTAAQTTYSVTAYLGNCKASDALVVNTLPYPTVDAGPDTTICFGTPAFLHGASNGDRVFWSPAGMISNNVRLNATAYPSSSGLLYLTARNLSGCTNPISDSVLITVLPRILVDAGHDTSLVVNQPLQLTGTTNATLYRWSPPLGLDNPDILTPILTISPAIAGDLSDPLVYTLTATNAAGCSVEDKVVIRMFTTGPSIFVPNGFTPNNDGLNDVIRPVLAGMKSLTYFRIYNRYGQLVFETKQVGKGWDGKVNGKLQPTGAFVFDCQAIDYLDKPARLQGTFVLIR